MGLASVSLRGQIEQGGDENSIQSAASEINLNHDRSMTIQKTLVIETNFDSDEGNEDPKRINSEFQLNSQFQRKFKPPNRISQDRIKYEPLTSKNSV